MNREPTISEVWKYLRLSGEPSVKCCSPLRPDKSPSFSVYVKEGREYFKDFAVSDCKGNVWDFISYAKKCGHDIPDNFIEEVQKKGLPSQPKFSETTKEEKQLLWKNLLRKGELVDLWALAKLRKLKIETMERAQDLGFLRFLRWRNRPCWVVTDPTLQCAQARRMDGLPWEEKNDAKAITLPGSNASWPLGSCVVPDNFDESYLLVEGGPDLLAALQSTEGSGQAVCAMMGVSNNFTQDTIKHFQDCRVFICPHNDEPGQEAALKWRRQLNGVAEVIISRIPPPHKDYNDWISAEMS